MTLESDGPSEAGLGNREATVAAEWTDAPVSVSDVTVGGRTWRRLLVKTPWIHSGDDLETILRVSLLPHAEPNDLIVLSEKATTIALGAVVPIDTVTVGPLARRMARMVRPRGVSKGLSIPEKMQYVIDEIGRPRAVLALIAAGLTRPLGIRGAFYLVAGRRARAMDGGRPPFEHLLLPPLTPQQSHAEASALRRVLGYDVAISDMNDRGGSIRAVSGGPIPPRLLRRILADNPMGQRDARTPIGLVRQMR
ncbi:coenzyme F420-0:L-glutamate ligase [Euzebya tangerina]|uniref:coenzyme F420-0:L-glutamate ligase n=1 Tax=Euzebya tangerina TaxID=591198 RepID=UPI000E312894|nr:coenzyme F420-0:L-glutamate ligase [Euzebya tangerina]